MCCGGMRSVRRPKSVVKHWLEVIKKVQSLRLESRAKVAVGESCDAKEERKEVEKELYLYSLLL